MISCGYCDNNWVFKRKKEKEDDEDEKMNNLSVKNAQIST